MKMERLSQNKIRIFLTFDDLLERGIQKDDMWKELEKVHELFSEMMEKAYNELGFEASGPLVVEVFKLPAQGMVVIVTKNGFQSESKLMDEDFDEDDINESYEFEVTLEQTDTITFAFKDFEYVLAAAKILDSYNLPEAALYSWKQLWVLRIEAVNLDEILYQNVVAILSEYGESVSVTQAVLEEYGKKIIQDDAITVLCSHFMG